MLGQLARFGADAIEEDSEKNPDGLSLDRCLDILIAFHTVPQGAMLFTIHQQPSIWDC